METMNLEDELREALRRKPAPPDLADRVLQRIERERRPAIQGQAPRRVMRWLAAAAALALLATGGTRYYHEQQQAAETQRVEQQLRLALQIANEKIALAQQRLERVRQD
jgi:hypothetical protein